MNGVVDFNTTPFMQLSSKMYVLMIKTISGGRHETKNKALIYFDDFIYFDRG